MWPRSAKPTLGSVCRDGGVDGGGGDGDGGIVIFPSDATKDERGNGDGDDGNDQDARSAMTPSAQKELDEIEK